MSKAITCPYCKIPAVLVTGRDVYPHIKNLHHKKFWKCSPCEAWVGTHENSLEFKPLGRLAKKELRDLKMKAHMVFDKFWKDGPMQRTEAYTRLAAALGVETTKCHIGWMSEEECRKVIEICRGWKYEPRV